MDPMTHAPVIYTSNVPPVETSFPRVRVASVTVPIAQQPGAALQVDAKAPSQILMFLSVEVLQRNESKDDYRRSATFQNYGMPWIMRFLRFETLANRLMASNIRRSEAVKTANPTYNLRAPGKRPSTTEDQSTNNFKYYSPTLGIPIPSPAPTNTPIPLAIESRALLITITRNRKGSYRALPIFDENVFWHDLDHYTTCVDYLYS
ncbi:hypothetical protein F4801DRAFT_596973 [Xylaria longipes]|nr:hypothetical protein F4801DRAFT_596973 [Xylaria longipes]